MLVQVKSGCLVFYKLLNEHNKTPGTFQARDNIALFINWLKGLNVDSAVLFEPKDLAEHKLRPDFEKNVLYSLMELGRVQRGIDPPRVRCVPFFFFFFNKKKKKNLITICTNTLHSVPQQLVQIEQRMNTGNYMASLSDGGLAS